MRYFELKKLIGLKAKDIIVSGKSLKRKGNNNYSCPSTNHKTDNISTQWYNDSLRFFCHDCTEKYDIINFAYERPNGFEYLHELAGVEFKKKEFKKVKAISTSIKNRGIEYLKSRGISKETIDTYKTTSNDEFIFFNYATPDKILVKIKKRFIDKKEFIAVKGGDEIFYGMHLINKQKTFICTEGEIDTLTLYETIKQMGKEKEIFCTNVPNGSGSLNKKLIDNCKCWLDQFDNIIILPNNDLAGKKLTKSALELLGDYNLEIIELPKQFNDFNNYYFSPDHNSCDVFSYSKKLIPKLVGVVNSLSVEPAKLKNGIRTGFITHDYNDNGLKYGKTTILTGRRGEGKTTYSRQIVYSVARQSINSFIYVGETTRGNEKNKLARLCAEEGEIVMEYGIAQNKIYSPSIQAIERYDKYYSKYIYLADTDSIKRNGRLFENLIFEMRKMAKSYNVKVFLLDNLMVMCEKEGNALFSEQKAISLSLKAFAEETYTHVVLIAHPKKGKDESLVSGAAEIENCADTIIRYIRLDDEQKEQLAKKMPENKLRQLERASARIKMEKVREDGYKKVGWLEWDAKKGAVYDVSDLSAANWYEEQGFWTRSLLPHTKPKQYID